MRIYLVNDTSSYHAGSAAVIASLRRKLDAEGHEVIHATPRPRGPERRWIRACDAVVVNGEGAMQEEAKGWDDHRVTRIMEGLALAKDLGKRAYLVNSVWYRNSPGWGDLLRSLDGVWVREVASQREMEREQGFRPEVFPDLSHSCPIDENVPARALAGLDVVGTVYERNMAEGERFGRFSRRLWRAAHLGLGGDAERRGHVSWSHVVKSLRGANVYATGQHHGVYAACRARVPFAPFRLYNHKITGLFEWAGVDIPIATTLQELLEGMEWAKNNRALFEGFFDWLDAQPAWPGIGSA